MRAVAREQSQCCKGGSHMSGLGEWVLLRESQMRPVARGHC
jgi:hypothetical protein